MEDPFGCRWVWSSSTWSKIFAIDLWPFPTKRKEEARGLPMHLGRGGNEIFGQKLIFPKSYFQSWFIWIWGVGFQKKYFRNFFYQKGTFRAFFCHNSLLLDIFRSFHDNNSILYLSCSIWNIDRQLNTNYISVRGNSRKYFRPERYFIAIFEFFCSSSGIYHVLSLIFRSK